MAPQADSSKPLLFKHAPAITDRTRFFALGLGPAWAFALLACALGSFIASRPRHDFGDQYQKLSSPKVILFLDHANQIPVEPVSRLHGVSLTWVYYDPAEEKSDYHRARRLMRIRPNAAVQFRSDRRDSELTLLRTEIAQLWGPKIEKDRRGDTHYIFVTDALYQQDKDWHDHPQKLCAYYFKATALPTLAGFTLLWAVFCGFLIVLRALGIKPASQAHPAGLASSAARRAGPRSRLTHRSFLLKRAARRIRRQRVRSSKS